MIRWTRPCKLEEFLLPNENGLNWSLPLWMEQKLEHEDTKRSYYACMLRRIVRLLGKDSNTVVEVRTQDTFGGSLLYDELIAKNGTKGAIADNYETIFHDLFRMMFKPSPPVAKRIRKNLEASQLVPGEYSVAHYRAFYGIENEKEKRSSDALISNAINAANCASQLRPGGPVYFASDSKVANEAVRHHATVSNHSIVTFDSAEALHLDKGSGPPSDYYSVFVDLYLMGNGRCISYGQGGFGQFALLMSYNATCMSRHFYKLKMQKCDWRDS